MNATEMKTMKNFEELCTDRKMLEISGTTICDPGTKMELDCVTFRDNGVLVLCGDCDLKIRSVHNQKENSSLCNYEFIIQGADGKNAEQGENGEDALNGGKVDIEIENIVGNIRVNACGGNGGKGFDGIDGQNGGAAPIVNITYTSIKKGAIYVNDTAVNRNKKYICRIPGGKGGVGSKGINEQLNGNSGKNGRDADGGVSGKNGSDGTITIQRIPLKKILENLNGLYVFDLSNDEDREYCIAQLGGMEKLKESPHLLEALNKCRSLNADQEENSSIAITSNGNTFYKADEVITDNLSNNSLSSDNYRIMRKSFCFDLYDNKTEISDKRKALKWKYIHINVSTVNNTYGISTPIISQSYEMTDTNGGVHDFFSDLRPSGDFEGKLATRMQIYGTDVNGNVVIAEYRSEENMSGDKVKKYPVTNIEVKDPSCNRRHGDKIVMLYARSNERTEYENADYAGGDFCKNAVKANKKIATLMPVTGTVTFNDDCIPVELAPPDKLSGFTRSSLNYNNKSPSSLRYQNDIMDDNVLYNLMKTNNCFKKYCGVVDSHVDFDLSVDRGDNTSKLDWHHDISGEANNSEQIVLLRAAFSYRVRKKGNPETNYDDIQICIIGISRENLDMINKESPQNKQHDYYKFVEGSNIVYIPPIYIYWGCFGKNVRIKTAYGATKAASDIQIGDMLQSYHGKSVTVCDIITGFEETIYHLKCADGYETQLSEAHPVLCANDKSIPVKQLRAGDQILTETGLKTVQYIQNEMYRDTVYNFIFADEPGSIFLIADGIYAGDLHAQNETALSPEETEEEKERITKLVEEMRRMIT